MINQLEGYLPEDLSFSFTHGNNERGNWKRFWTFAKEIQEKFNSGIKYPSNEERQKAWNKFNSLRNEASKRSKIERSLIEDTSKRIRDTIFSMCSGLKYVPFTDVLFFFDKTQAWEIKKSQKLLIEAQKELSKQKHRMLGEHKQQCWELMQEIRQSHQLFWEQHNRAWEAKKRERATEYKQRQLEGQKVYEQHKVEREGAQL